MFQLKEHGPLGMHGEFALAHATVMQHGLVQETLQEEPIHAWGAKMK